MLKIGDVPIGDGAPIVLIAGLNVLEDRLEAIASAQILKDLAEAHGLPLVFKASFDKANRSRYDAYRGPGIDEGLRMLADIKRQVNLPLITDVHERGQAKIASEVVDALQVPAFLCRQTGLIQACAATGLPVNLKKAQFLSPTDLRHAVDKVERFGGAGAFVTERGSAFGYNNLVTDMRGLVQMREFAPVCFDATHAVQYPGSADGASGGDRRFVAPLARAAVAVGIDALFVEAHLDPDDAPVDGPSQITFEALDRLLAEVCAIERGLAGLSRAPQESKEITPAS